MSDRQPWTSPATIERLMSAADVTVANNGQHVDYQAILQFGGHRLRILIRSDSYNFQSFARIEAWSKADTRWNEVAHIDHGAMLTQPGLWVYMRHETSANPFRADANELLRLALLVLA